MKREDFETYKNLAEQVEAEAEKIILIYSRIQKDKTRSVESSAHYAEFQKIEDGRIKYYGEDTWSYGGYEQYWLDLPERLIILPEKVRIRYLNFRFSRLSL